jgi:hypothetical protein
MMVRKLTNERDNENLSINNGNIGARNEEYTSCTKCANDIVITLPCWNLFLSSMLLADYFAVESRHASILQQFYKLSGTQLIKLKIIYGTRGNFEKSGLRFSI